MANQSVRGRARSTFDFRPSTLDLRLWPSVASFNDRRSIARRNGRSRHCAVGVRCRAAPRYKARLEHGRSRCFHNRDNGGPGARFAGDSNWHTSYPREDPCSFLIPLVEQRQRHSPLRPRASASRCPSRSSAQNPARVAMRVRLARPRACSDRAAESRSVEPASRRHSRLRLRIALWRIPVHIVTHRIFPQTTRNRSPPPAGPGIGHCSVLESDHPAEPASSAEVMGSSKLPVRLVRCSGGGPQYPRSPGHRRVEIHGPPSQRPCQSSIRNGSRSGNAARA